MTQPPQAQRAAQPRSITDVPGIEVGHFTDTRRPTGCTVLIARKGAVAGVDVRGAAPGTRETDLLHPSNLIERVHAVLLSGGSAWGLDAASGVMQWLEEANIGFRVSLPAGDALVPIVPGAVVFDLAVGDARIRPDARAGYAACAAASRQAPAEGSVGAGAGALVGKLAGIGLAMRGGVGTAALCVHGITVGALVVCNAMGDVVDPHTGQVIAGARTDDGRGLRDIRQSLLRGAPSQSPMAGHHTTIGVVATDAVLTKPQAHRLAVGAHDGLARTINPVHTQFDGDTLFALATGESGIAGDMTVLAMLAAEVTAQAVLRAVWAATGTSFGEHYWPSARELAKTGWAGHNLHHPMRPPSS